MIDTTTLTGTGTMLRFMLRRDRERLTIWVGAIGLTVLMLIYSLPTVAATESDLASVSQLYRDPVGRFMIGPGYGFDSPSYAAFLTNGYGMYLLVPVALMSIFLVARHTRAEEQSGRAEIVRAGAVGRLASLAAPLLLAVIANLVVGILVAGILIGVGPYDANGSLLFGTSVTATGLVFAAVTAIVAQVAATSGGAAGLASAVLGIAFALRAVGDVVEEGGSALSWLSPLGWAQQTAPFALDRWWPLGWSILLATGCAAVALLWASRRDLGSSLGRSGVGRASAGRWLGTPVGLAWRLQRGSIVAWGVALLMSGLLFGAYAQTMVDAAANMPPELRAVLGEGDVLAGYFNIMAVVMALLASSYGISAVLGFRVEETSGRLEAVLATAVDRMRWLGSNLLVVLVGVGVILAVAGLATGVGAWFVTGESEHVVEILLTNVNQGPAVMVVLGLAAALFGVEPKAIGASWLVVAYGLFVITFASLIQVPEAARNASPYEMVAAVPTEDFEPLPVLALIGAAALLTVIGLVTFRRRDLA